MERKGLTSHPSPLQETAHYWRDTQTPGLEMLAATYVTHAFSRHSHDHYAIAVIERGAESFTYNSQGTYIVGAGRIAAIDPGVLHTGATADGADGWRYRVFYPSVELLTELARIAGWRGTSPPAFPSVVYDDPELFARLVRLHDTLENSDLSALERDSRLLMTLGLFAARHAVSSGIISHERTGAEHIAARRARDFLEAHPTENIPLQELAERAGLSPFHLLRVFKDAWGMPPHAFQTLRRVEEARRLLRDGMPVAQTALVSGFSDQSHLTRHFRRVVGVAPGRFLRSHEHRKNVQERYEGPR